jgi:DNA-binding NarL/FixJ family response regulator
MTVSYVVSESDATVNHEVQKRDSAPNGDRLVFAAKSEVGVSGPNHPSLLIVDDSAVHREALATALTVNGIAPVTTAWDLPSIIASLERAAPQLILLNMDSRGLQIFLRAVMSLSPGVPVIALGASEEDEDGIIVCAEAGVAAYHMRSQSLQDLIILITSALDGKTACPPQVSAMLLRRVSTLAGQRQPTPRDPVLTAREAQILGMLELGRSNQDIAAALSIAVHTVKNHVHSLLTKLGVSSRAEAAALSHTLRLDQDAQRRARSRSNQKWL